MFPNRIPRRSMPSTLFAVLVGCVLLSFAGCRVYDPGLVQQEDGGTVEQIDAAAECPLRKPPQRPNVVDDPADARELTFALRDVALNQDGERWRSIGFDVDGLCTEMQGSAIGCRPPDPEAQPELDGDDGIDNAFGHHLYPLVSLAVEDLERSARDAQKGGHGTILVMVRGWNGRPNDARVDITLGIATAGTTSGPTEPAPDVDFSSDGEPLRKLDEPAWDGNDYFWLRDDGFVDGRFDRPRLRDDNGYVADGKVVGRLPEGTDILFGADDKAVLVRLQEAEVVLEIEGDGQRGRVEVAGRWKTLDILDTAARVGVCPGSSIYDAVEEQLSRVADVRSQRTAPDPSLACDAISLGVTFGARRARVAGLAPSPEIPNACNL